jgi:hypothetical protein
VAAYVAAHPTVVVGRFAEAQGPESDFVAAANDDDIEEFKVGLFGCCCVCSSAIVVLLHALLSFLFSLPFFSSLLIVSRSLCKSLDRPSRPSRCTPRGWRRRCIPRARTLPAGPLSTGDACLALPCLFSLVKCSFPLVDEVGGHNFGKYAKLAKPLHLVFVEPSDPNKERIIADLTTVAAEHKDESFSWIDAAKYKAQVNTTACVCWCRRLTLFLQIKARRCFSCLLSSSVAGHGSVGRGGAVHHSAEQLWVGEQAGGVRAAAHAGEPARLGPGRQERQVQVHAQVGAHPRGQHRPRQGAFVVSVSSLLFSSLARCLWARTGTRL